MAKKVNNKPEKEKVPKSIIGMITDGAQVVLVQLEGKKQNAVLTAKHKEFLPKGLIDAGLITDPVKLGEIVGNILKKGGFSNADIIFGAKGQNVLMRIAPFAKIPGDKMKNSIIFGAQQVLPIPIPELVLDCVVCDEFVEDGRTMVNALVVGAKKVYINNVISTVDVMGKTLNNIDIAALAQVRSIIQSNPLGDLTFLMVYVDYENVNMIVVKNEVILMTRTLNLTDACYNSNIPKTGLTPDEYWGAVVDEDEFAQQVSSDIKASISFFEAQQRRPIDKIFVTGEYNKIGELAKCIQDKFEAEINTVWAYPDILSKDDMSYTAAVSLAMSGLGE